MKTRTLFQPRSLFHGCLVLLLFLAGPAGAFFPMMPMAPTASSATSMSEAHCEEMNTTHAEHASASSDTSMGSLPSTPSQDCDTQCQCCPGTCSGSTALTASPTLFSRASVIHGAIPFHHTPQHAPAELLRPPITA